MKNSSPSEKTDFRSSLLQMYFKICVLKNCTNSTGKQLYNSRFSKAADLKTCNSVKKGLQHRGFLEKFEKFLSTHCFYTTAPVAASEVQLMFSKESRTKAGVA